MGGSTFRDGCSGRETAKSRPTHSYQTMMWLVHPLFVQVEIAELRPKLSVALTVLHLAAHPRPSRYIELGCPVTYKTVRSWTPLKLMLLLRRILTAAVVVLVVAVVVVEPLYRIRVSSDVQNCTLLDTLGAEALAAALASIS